MKEVKNHTTTKIMTEHRRPPTLTKETKSRSISPNREKKDQDKNHKEPNKEKKKDKTPNSTTNRPNASITKNPDSNRNKAVTFRKRAV